ncbi:hypothetical protein Ancab_022708 [Ancistrocladus abbreviatus]
MNSGVVMVAMLRWEQQDGGGGRSKFRVQYWLNVLDYGSRKAGHKLKELDMTVVEIVANKPDKGEKNCYCSRGRRSNSGGVTESSAEIEGLCFTQDMLLSLVCV